MRRGLLSARACNSDIPSSVSVGARSSIACRPSLSLGVQTRRAISTYVCVKSMAKPALGSPNAALFIDGAYTDAEGSALLEVRGKNMMVEKPPSLKTLITLVAFDSPLLIRSRGACLRNQGTPPCKQLDPMHTIYPSSA
jgi:hypothetical protein